MSRFGVSWEIVEDEGVPEPPAPTWVTWRLFLALLAAAMLVCTLTVYAPHAHVRAVFGWWSRAFPVALIGLALLWDLKNALLLARRIRLGAWLWVAYLAPLYLYAIGLSNLRGLLPPWWVLALAGILVHGLCLFVLPLGLRVLWGRAVRQTKE